MLARSLALALATATLSGAPVAATVVTYEFDAFVTNRQNVGNTFFIPNVFAGASGTFSGQFSYDTAGPADGAPSTRSGRFNTGDLEFTGLQRFDDFIVDLEDPVTQQIFVEANGTTSRLELFEGTFDRPVADGDSVPRGDFLRVSAALEFTQTTPPVALGLPALPEEIDLSLFDTAVLSLEVEDMFSSNGESATIEAVRRLSANVTALREVLPPPPPPPPPPPVSEVPLPPGMLLLGTGIGVLALRRRA